MPLLRIVALFLLFGTVACAAPGGRRPAAAATAPEDRSAAWLFQRGVAALHSRDTVRAEQYLSLAMANGFPRRRVVPLLVRACVSSQRLRAAIDYAEPELRRNPDDVHLRYLVATLRLALGQREPAAAELESVLRTDPEYPDAHYLLGILHSERAETLEIARAHFGRYLAGAPHGRFSAEVRNLLVELSVPSRTTSEERAHSPNGAKP